MKRRTPYIVSVYSVFRILDVKINYFSHTLSRLGLSGQVGVAASRVKDLILCETLSSSTIVLRWS